MKYNGERMSVKAVLKRIQALKFKGYTITMTVDKKGDITATGDGYLEHDLILEPLTPIKITALTPITREKVLYISHYTFTSNEFKSK
jgi:hypothetical protein